MRRIMAGKEGAPVSLDHVLNEGLTLLQRRPGRPALSRDFAALFLGREGRPPMVMLHSFGREETLRSIDLHFERYDRGLSFTDCALVVLAKDLGCPIASFDAHFDGIVRRVSA